MLRFNISIIPQEPFFFTDTVRRNIDPLGLFTDQEVIESLKDSRLYEFIINNLQKGLLTDMSDAKSVFSVG